jgi:hypothetical protein
MMPCVKHYLSPKRKTAYHPKRWLIAVTVLLVCSLELSACSNNSSGGGNNGGKSGGTPAASAATLTYRNDNARTGQNLQEVILTPTNVNPANFGLLFSYPVDGYVFAQPLYKPNVAIGGQVHNVLFVATEHDSVYAFDADNPASGLLWQTSFINPAAGVTTVPFSDFSCTEIGTENGITSTPVIDPASGTLYVVAMTKENGTYVYRLHALSIATGADMSSVEIQASVPGTGDGSDGSTVSFDPFQHKQRAALLLSNGIVYLGFTSQCDNPPYHGWLFGYDATSFALVSVFNDTPNGSEGGIWNGGPSADANGNLFVMTGNGTFDGFASQDWGDSFLRLTAGLAVFDFFTPFNQADLAANDLDVGSAAPLLLPDQAVGPPHLLVGGGKEGRIYLVNRDNMGQFQSGSDSQIVQEVTGQLAVGPTGSLFTAPAYFNNTVYFAANTDVLKAFSLVNGQLSPSPIAQGATPFSYPGGELTISASGSTNGIVWALEIENTVLHAYLAANVANELYNSTMNPNDALELSVPFAVPTVVNGKVYVGTRSHVSVFGHLS